ncbi:unnamed protein product, partial [Brassica rapa]
PSDLKSNTFIEFPRRSSDPRRRNNPRILIEISTSVDGRDPAAKSQSKQA